MLRSKGSADRFARHLRYVEPLDCCCMSGKDARCNKRGYPSQGCFSFSWNCRGPTIARPCEVQAIVPRTRAVDTSAHGSLSEGLGPGTRWDLIACHRDVERSRQRRHSGAVDTGSQAALFIACALASAEHVYAGGVRSLDHGIITNFAASWRNEKMYPVALRVRDVRSATRKSPCRSVSGNCYLLLPASYPSAFFHLFPARWPKRPQASAPSSVLPTGGGAALLDPSDTVFLLLDHQSGLFQTVKDIMSPSCVPMW